jgi:hypothetical protein
MKKTSTEIYITLGAGYGELPVLIYMGGNSDQENVNNFFKLLHNDRDYREQFLKKYLLCKVVDEEEMPEDKTVYVNDDRSLFIDKKNKKVRFNLVKDNPKIWANNKPEKNPKQLEFNFNQEEPLLVELK